MRACIYKITYPNGRICTGQDRTHHLLDIGHVTSTLVPSSGDQGGPPASAALCARGMRAARPLPLQFS